MLVGCILIVCLWLFICVLYCRCCWVRGLTAVDYPDDERCPSVSRSDVPSRLLRDTINLFFWRTVSFLVKLTLYWRVCVRSFSALPGKSASKIHRPISSLTQDLHRILLDWTINCVTTCVISVVSLNLWRFWRPCVVTSPWAAICTWHVHSAAPCPVGMGVNHFVQPACR